MKADAVDDAPATRRGLSAGIAVATGTPRPLLGGGALLDLLLAAGREQHVDVVLDRQHHSGERATRGDGPLVVGGHLIARTHGDEHLGPTRRVDPTIALTWRLAPALSAFARFQTGYRTGGLAVASGVGRVADYQADDITVGELGVRTLRRGATGLSFSGSVSLARWDNIQADLINRRGQPYTANIGNARLEAFEASVDWVPVAGLRAEASLFLTDNTVSGPIADQSQRNNRRLPDTPSLALHAGLSYQWEAGGSSFRTGVTTDYVGRWVLGTGDFLDVSQGRYQVFGLFAGMRRRPFDIDLHIDNLTDRKANRFSFGNPFGIASRDLVTPLRPLNARIGIVWNW